MSARIFFALLVTLVNSTVFAMDAPSRIDAVTVYGSGAMVTRTANVSLSAGTNKIALTGLVDSIEEDQIRVEVANANVKIGQIKLSTQQERDIDDPDITALQGNIDALRETIQRVDDNTAGAKLQLTFLKGIASGYAGDAGYEGSRGAADLDAWRGALGLLLSASEDANKIVRENAAKKKELTKDLSLLERQLNDLRGGSLSTSVVELALVSSSAIQTQISLRYFQEDAYWSPRYEARLDSDTGRLQLAQQAQVSQDTDEEWNNVRLTLSTSEPDGELIAPQLASEFLNLYQPAPERKFARSMPVSSAMESATLDEIVVSGTKVRPDVGNFAVSYEVPGRTSLSNDSDEETKVDLDRFDFVAELVTQVVPRESTQAFLAARFVYDESVPLYGSNMSVFVDGAFVGNTHMPTALPQAEVVLPMGQDRRIEVVSETQGDMDGREGIIGRRKTETTDYVFELTNRRSAPSYIEVMDRYPVARNKDIDVDVPDSATSPGEQDLDDQPGLIMWKKTLSPGEAWRIRHQYTVSYPAKMVLTRQ